MEEAMTVGRARASISNLEVRGWFGRYNHDGDYIDERDENSSIVVKYLRMPSPLPLPFNLNLRHPEDEMRFNGTTYEQVFKWIMKHSKDENGKPCQPNAEVVCKRSFLVKMMKARYGKDAFVLHATKINEVIYFKFYWMDKFEMNKRNQYVMVPEETIHAKRIGYNDSNPSRYGSKFEQYLLADEPRGVPDPKRPVLQYDDMACVFRAKIGSHCVLYAGEIDGLPKANALKNLNNVEFTELKTVIDKPGSFVQQYGFKKFKSLAWWAQCILSKVTSVIVGLRNDSLGIVQRLDTVKVDMLPCHGKEFWEPRECFAFVDGLFCEMKSRLVAEEQIALMWSPASLLRVVDFKCKDLMESEIVPQFYREWLDSLPTQN